MHKTNCQYGRESSYEHNGINEIRNTIAGPCSVCRKPSTACCQRCFDFYCSLDCQRKDWNRHRYICFPMPPLVHVSCLSSMPTIESKLPELNCSLDFAPLQTHKFSSLQKGIIKEYKGTKTENAVNNNSDEKGTIKKASTKNGNSLQITSLLTSLLPKQDSCVLLTGFRSSNRCYVRESMTEASDGYLSVLKQTDTYGKTAPYLKKLPLVNTYAIAPLNGIMYRVEIVSARNENNILVHYCDYGIMGFCQLTELREISEDILKLKQYPVMIQLRNVDNYMICENLTNYLTKFEDKEFSIKFKANDERGGNVELYHWSSGKSLNEEIATYCKNMNFFNSRNREVAEKSTRKLIDSTEAYTIGIGNNKNLNRHSKVKLKDNVKKPQKETNILNPVLLQPFETHLFEVGATNVKAIIVDESCLELGYIGCICDEDIENLAAVQNYLIEYEPEDNQPYCPKLNEYCIAKFENYWYRAKVTEICDATHYTVMYVDFTNENNVTNIDIRRYPMNLTKDCRTNLCLIMGLPKNLSNEHIDLLKQEFQLQTAINIDKIKGVKEGVVLIECEDVLKKINKLT